MTYVIEWRPSARKEVRKLGPTVRRRVITAIENLADDPRPAGAIPLTGSAGWWRIRVGDYRVIYDIQDSALVVLVLRVGGRGGVYRTL